MPNFSIDITEGMGPSEIKVKPNGMNLTTNPLKGYVKVRTSDGFSQSIPLTQKTGNFTYKYYLEANPATIQIDSFGGSATLNITSRKETYLDGELIETDENWGYSLSADPGITLNGLTVTVGENVNNYDVTSKVVVTQNESGKKIEITIQQLAGEVVGEYEFSVSPTSLSFAALGQSRTFTVTSMHHYTFNGEWRDDSVPWQVQSITSPFQVSGNTVTIGENTNTSVRNGSLVLIQPASRKTVTITLSQAAAEITYSYNFSVSPSSLEFVATGETKTVSITSTRDRYVNGKYSSTENWNYTRSNGANVSGSGTSITMGENTGSSDRSGSVTFTQTTSGKSVTVTCKQSAAQIETSYVFALSPESLSFENTGGTQDFTVTSTKTVTVNGIPTTTNLDYTISGSVTGFSISKGSVTASANSSQDARSGSFTLTQNESNKTLTLSVSQSATQVVEGWKYYMFSSLYGNAASKPNIDVEDPIPAEGGNLDIGDWIFAFGVKTQNGVPVIGSDDLDLNGWSTIITNSANYENVKRLEQSNLKLTASRATLDGIVRTNDQSTLQYYSLTPKLTIEENVSGIDISIYVYFSLQNVTYSGELRYVFTQKNYDVIFTFQDGSTSYGTAITFSGVPDGDNIVWGTPSNIPLIVRDTNGKERMAVCMASNSGGSQQYTPDGWKLDDVYFATSGVGPSLNNPRIYITTSSNCMSLYDGTFRYYAKTIYSNEYGNPSDELDEKRVMITCKVSGYRLFYRLRVPSYILTLGQSEGYQLNVGRPGYGVHIYNSDQYGLMIDDHKPFQIHLSVKLEREDQSFLMKIPDGHQPGNAWNMGSYCYDEVVPIFMYQYNQITSMSRAGNSYMNITYYNESTGSFKSIRTTDFTMSNNWSSNGKTDSSNFGTETDPKFTITIGDNVTWS